MFGVSTETLSVQACTALGVAPEMKVYLDLCDVCLRVAGVR
jgi:hypothetical protein